MRKGGNGTDLAAKVHFNRMLSYSNHAPEDLPLREITDDDHNPSACDGPQVL